MCVSSINRNYLHGGIRIEVKKKIEKEYQHNIERPLKELGVDKRRKKGT